MGSTQPSYQRIDERLTSTPGAMIDVARMPPGVSSLKDLKHWVRATIRAWTKHLLDGQRGIIPVERRFAWRIVPRPRGEPDRVVDKFVPQLAPGVKLLWTRVELRYAEAMTAEIATPEGVTPQWNGLPLARTSHIYSPYSGVLYEGLIRLHETNDVFLGLIQNAARMEQLGPIHVSNCSAERHETHRTSAQRALEY